jgi:hypothetical protein
MLIVSLQHFVERAARDVHTPRVVTSVDITQLAVSSIMEAARRLSVLLQHVDLDGADRGKSSGLREDCIAQQPCSAAQGQVIDSQAMEVFMDPNRAVKEDVYKSLLERPELLVPHIEGLSKESHRELVRNSLRRILEIGYSPLKLFDSDIAKYIYMAEICAPVDLSLVRRPLSSPQP